MHRLGVMLISLVLFAACGGSESGESGTQSLQFTPAEPPFSGGRCAPQVGVANVSGSDVQLIRLTIIDGTSGAVLQTLEQAEVGAVFGSVQLPAGASLQGQVSLSPARALLPGQIFPFQLTLLGINLNGDTTLFAGVISCLQP